MTPIRKLPHPSRATLERRKAQLRQLTLFLGYDPASPDPDCYFAFDINADRMSLSRAYDRFMALREREPDKVPVLLQYDEFSGWIVAMPLAYATFLVA